MTTAGEWFIVALLLAILDELGELRGKSSDLFPPLFLSALLAGIVRGCSP